MAATMLSSLPRGIQEIQFSPKGLPPMTDLEVDLAALHHGGAIWAFPFHEVPYLHTTVLHLCLVLGNLGSH